MDALFEAFRRDLVSGAVSLDAFGERTAAAQRLVEFGVRGPVLVRITLADADVEIRLHLIDEADVLARELAPGTVQGT